MMRLKKTGLFAIGMLFLLGSLQSQAATQYKIEDLGKIPDGADKTVSINNNGDHTISLQNEFGGKSTYLISNGIKQEIGTNGNVVVSALNDIKQATGSLLADELTNKRSAFLYSDGNLTNIETLDVRDSYGFDINNSGVSVGETTTNPLGYSKAFIHDSQTGQMVLLDDIAPVDELSPIYCTFTYDCWQLTRAFGINDLGMITGSAITPNNADDFPTMLYSKYRAFLLDGQNLKSLGTLGGDFSIGQAINDNGHIAGISDLYHESWINPFDPNAEPPQPDPFRVFLYDGQKMIDIGILEGGRSSLVTAINNHDEIVGSVRFDAYTHAFKSTQRGLLDLNSLISGDANWTELTTATDINDSGVIVGYGQMNGENHGFKLVPIEKSELACLHVSAEICTTILSKTQ